MAIKEGLNYDVVWSDLTLFLNTVQFCMIVYSLSDMYKPKWNNSLALQVTSILTHAGYITIWTTYAFQTQYLRVDDKSCHIFIAPMSFTLLILIPGIFASLLDLYLSQLVEVMNQSPMTAINIPPRVIFSFNSFLMGVGTVCAVIAYFLQLNLESVVLMDCFLAITSLINVTVVWKMVAHLPEGKFKSYGNYMLKSRYAAIMYAIAMAVHSFSIKKQIIHGNVFVCFPTPDHWMTTNVVLMRLFNMMEYYYMTHALCLFYNTPLPGTGTSVMTSKAAPVSTNDSKVDSAISRTKSLTTSSILPPTPVVRSEV